MIESDDLKQLVAAWFGAVSRGDASLIDRHVPLDSRVRLVGSDPGEWIAGGAAVAEFLRGEVEGSGGNATFSPADIEAFEEDGVGWAATRLTIRLPDGLSISPRWTAVFHREGDTWKFVQTHASIAVPNDEAGWVYGPEG